MKIRARSCIMYLSPVLPIINSKWMSHLYFLHISTHSIKTAKLTLPAWSWSYAFNGFLVPTEFSVTSSAWNAGSPTTWVRSGSSSQKPPFSCVYTTVQQLWTNYYLSNRPHNFPELYFWQRSLYPQNRHCTLFALNSIRTFFTLLLILCATSAWDTDTLLGRPFTGIAAMKML